MQPPVVARFVVEVIDLGRQWEVTRRFETPFGRVSHDVVAAALHGALEALEEMAEEIGV